jgi:hypothetical protein
MSVKQGTGEAFTPREVLQDSHAITVKADCLKPSSQGCLVHPLAERLMTTPADAAPTGRLGEILVGYVRQLPADGHDLPKVGKRTNGLPTAC